MSKKHIYCSDAERFYVVEQMTVNEVADRLQLNHKTVLAWKAEFGWEEKRHQLLKSKQLFHEELYEFTRKLMTSIKNDIDNDKKVDTGRIYAFTRMLPLITKIKDYEDISAKKEKTQESKGLTEDVIKLIEKEVLGMNSEE